MGVYLLLRYVMAGPAGGDYYRAAQNTLPKALPLRSSLERHIATVMEWFINWLSKPLYTSALTEVYKPVSTQSSVPSIKVQLNPVLDDKDTATSAISKGLISLSNASKKIKDLSPAEGTQNVTDAIADIIINVINTMATVRDKHKPTRIHAYHVYATRTGIASFINIRSLIVTPYQSDPGTVVKDIFSAFVYFGMAILVTPAPYTAHLASALAGRQNCVVPQAGLRACL
ncbi:hypothetical protein V8F33_004188 [Rhypophila sp. PSN 637]